MKKTTIVIPHQVNQVMPMLAADARLSMVRIAEIEKRRRSARPRTRSRVGFSVKRAGPRFDQAVAGLRFRTMAAVMAPKIIPPTTVVKIQIVICGTRPIQNHLVRGAMAATSGASGG